MLIREMGLKFDVESVIDLVNSMINRRGPAIPFTYQAYYASTSG